MWLSEKEFQIHLIQLLYDSRLEIEVEYRPFEDLRVSVDIKAINRTDNVDDIEEWRELKIINYKGKGRSIQNLWKGLGKVSMMQDLAEQYFEELKINNILSLARDDFHTLSPKIQQIVQKKVSLELVSELEFKFE